MNKNLKFKLTALIFLLVTNSYSQEIKLGIPFGHSYALNSAVFSRDGKNILTTSRDKTARLWDASTGKLIHTLEGHNDIFLLGNFSSDGKLILTISEESIINVWDTSTGQILYKIDGTQNSTLGEFSEVGQLKLKTLYGNNFKNVLDNNIRKILDLNWNFYDDLSPDGKFVVKTSDNVIALWDAISDKQILSFNGHKDIVTSVRFSPDSKSIVSASADNTARLWDISSGKFINTLEGHTDFVKSAVFSPDGKTFITAADEIETYLWSTATGKLLLNFEDQTSKVNNADTKNSDIDNASNPVSKDSLTDLLIASRPNYFNHRTTGFSYNSVVFSKNGKKVLITDTFADYLDVPSTYVTRLYNSSTGKRLQIFKGVSFQAINFSPNGKKLLQILAEKDVNKDFYNIKTHILDASTGKLILSFENNSDFYLYGKFSPDGENILTISPDNSILWDSNNGEPLYDFLDNNDEVSYTKFSPKGNRLLIVSYNYLSLWDTTSVWPPQCHDPENENCTAVLNLEVYNDDIYTAVFSPDGNNIITGAFNSIRLFDVASRKPLKTLKLGYGHNLKIKYSPDGKSILIAGDKQASLWDASLGELLQTFEGNFKFIESIEFSSDGKRVLITLDEFEEGLGDKTMSLWDTTSGKLLNTIFGDSKNFNSLKFSPNGKTIISSTNGTTTFWDAKDGKPLIHQYTFDGDPSKWVHLHPSGLFDASPEAMDLMYWTKGLEIIEFAQLKDRYWLPGLWEKVMNGEPLPNTRGMSELKLQPEVELSQQDETIKVKLTKRDGGYGKTTLLINGKEAIADIRPIDMDYTLPEQTISLSIKDHPLLKDGDNNITVKASSEDGFVQGRGAKLKTVIEKKTVKQPQFFGVVIGVGDYANDQINLRYTVNDAEAIAKAMQIGAENLFDKDKSHIYTITSKSDELPNKKTIQNIFKEISTKANAEDVITVYLSGHGITWGGDQGDFYFLTSDAMATSSEAFNDAVIRENHAISTAEWVDWLKNISALKQVMIIDACGSGKAVDNLIAERDIEPSQIKAIDRMKDRTGMYIISGCTADAVSYEASMYGQGLLTYSILQAMKGAALKEDKFVDVSTILNYARERVPELAKGIGGIQEPQLLIPRGGSFDIGLLNSKDIEAIPLANPKTVFVRSTLVDANDFEDQLGLTELLNEELTIISARGTNAPLVYFDVSRFSNACKISGGYTVGKNNISISLKIRCGEVLKEYDLKSDNKENLIKKILALLEE